MKIGIIGGFSAYSTAKYYQLLSEFTQNKLCHLAPEILIYHLNASPIIKALSNNDFDTVFFYLFVAARRLIRLGANTLVIPCNTLHLVAAKLQAYVRVPLIHIGDAVGNFAVKKSATLCLLLGSRYTMQLNFYRDYLNNQYDINVITPKLSDQKTIHQIIFNEFCAGRFSTRSSRIIAKIVDNYSDVSHIILGCTELSLLDHSLFSKPCIDTLCLHVDAIVSHILKQRAAHAA